ncbi:MAG TPA: 2-amino-4-ketopentanoate thiolase, partial [Clostridiales bacterium UBA8960]|nr:2-amino-4-ketopentanoate thiolase [Clostridiales bacterium UBA8960]
VPLEMWVKGFIDRDAAIGDAVEVTTITGRKEFGSLTEVEPTYRHSFGNFVPEILEIGIQLKGILFGGDADER